MAEITWLDRSMTVIGVSFILLIFFVPNLLALLLLFVGELAIGAFCFYLDAFLACRRNGDSEGMRVLVTVPVILIVVSGVVSALGPHFQPLSVWLLSLLEKAGFPWVLLMLPLWLFAVMGWMYILANMMNYAKQSPQQRLKARAVDWSHNGMDGLIAYVQKTSVGIHRTAAVWSLIAGGAWFGLAVRAIF